MISPPPFSAFCFLLSATAEVIQIKPPKQQKRFNYTLSFYNGKAIQYGYFYLASLNFLIL
jgi:hypothetical protein